MKKKLCIFAILVVVLSIVLSTTSLCFAEAENEDLSQIEDSTSWFEALWAKVEPYVMGALSGISVSGIVSAVFYALIRTQTNKTLSKLDDNSSAEKMTKDTIDGVVGAIANTTLSMNIQPIVESKLRAITETIYADLERANKDREEKDLAVVEILSALASYFDNSIGVSDEAKDALKQAVENAKGLYVGVEVPQVVIETTKEVVVEEKKETKKVVENY